MSGLDRLQEARARHAQPRKVAALMFAIFLAACSGNGQPNTGGGAAGAQPEKVIVTDANGMTVYIHDADLPSKSRCNDACSDNWPPVRPTPDLPLGGKFSVIARKDGTQQLAYDGRPLYTFKYDQKPGDTNGDGRQGKWHVFYY